MYHFAQQPPSDNEQTHATTRQKRHLSVKETLRQCKNTIAELANTNQQLNKKLRQKQTIIVQLISEKQQYLLHKANCNAQALIKQLQIASQREQQLAQIIKEMQQKYDKIVDKQKSQIQRLTSYNRALRIDNASLREYKELHLQRKRKNGVISQSLKKEKQMTNQFEITRINEDNVEQKLERHFSVTLQTPNKNTNYVKYNCQPSTEPSLKAFHSIDLSSEKSHLPKNLFSNNKLKQHAPAESQQHKFPTNVLVNNRLMSIQSVIRRVNELLSESEEQS